MKLKMPEDGRLYPPMPRRLIALACMGLLSGTAFAGSPHLNLLVASSYYGGDTATITPGVTSSGGVVDSYDGSYPNVFKNNGKAADDSFGVTSGITLETFDPDTNTQTGSIDVTEKASLRGVNITTSFSSKSELALTASPDGKDVTFVGYNAPINQLDVSNANTAAVIDPSNVVTSIWPRAIGQIDLDDGSVRVKTVNAYSGNNGRSVVFVNGKYYMAGNAGNSGKHPKPPFSVYDALSANTGVQMLDQKTATVSGGAYNTTVIGQQVCPECAGDSGTGTGNQYGYSVTQYSDASGTPYPADKTGKDDNFRGITVFNNTLYVTKGSGSNGIDTVFQVGKTGALAHGGSIPSDASITVLPGFNAVSEKVLEKGPNAPYPNGIYHPFGIWFANANTLYVADEGGKVADAANTAVAGLEKWVFDGSKWNLAYTLQNGLDLGQTYTVTGGIKPDGSVDPNGTGYTYTTSTSGLRHITGRVNHDGTVTIYATTSTMSDEAVTGDQGADPNKLVTITDNLAFTTSAQAAGESFTDVQTAAYGQVLRGVALVEARQWQKSGHHDRDHR